MSNDDTQRLKPKDRPGGTQQVLKWAMCHPGVLLLGSLAVGAVLARSRGSDQPPLPERRAETEADIVDGDVPLFI